ncbi:hypothetical protein kac65v162_gp119 [Nodularia phage vB_NspS-kac65v162]|jgi:hypothetical protein|uniref:Uncharacterized protein n=5 Tax=Ravarandavirus TaxID=2843444 RepID=A0A482MIY4_9CAUD|nr:hypothetical protein HWC12_gp198 [Nodularia phage vB_NspS-kac65v151]YP_009844930.1 hypothetical protein HWC13_gp190 [Nodularia phage vB_NspS-kac68v161]QBQ73357.1 hypothetical protein kac65v161_gp119 [Nodularia phage vB_NspS-kac65v161]QBQ73563.1 hypothetical protein kac65v162_gp119 [Nodularia phage vB_NspS-kac65v162]QBQ73967.1 hypothetical protein kac68v162_gp119 [Nodularia phage vB_NspS-kac68v162]QBQ73149.1 hypothetical protein kac65v151_gp119 [Nodularia phage vB_NspS-kac65v151]QBQ73771.1 
MIIRVRGRELLCCDELLDNPDDLMGFTGCLAANGLDRYWFISVRDGDEYLNGNDLAVYHGWKRDILSELHRLKTEAAITNPTATGIYYLWKRYPKVKAFIEEWHKSVLSDPYRVFKFGTEITLFQAFSEAISTEQLEVLTR